MSDIERAYSNIVTVLEGLINFHPEMANLPSDADKATLASYYFFGRPVDVANIQIYRRQLLEANPGLQIEAESALSRFLAQISMAGDPAIPGDWL